METQIFSDNYRDFTQWHLKELVRLRFLPDDWSQEFVTDFINKTGEELLIAQSEDFDSILKSANLSTNEFKTWTGFDMIYDFYRLRSADELAFTDIGEARLKQYEIVCKQLKESENSAYRLWANIFEKSINGKPSDHFKIDLKQGTIESITP